MNNVKFKATPQWMAENYAKANEELFNGSLGECRFLVENIGTRHLGLFCMEPYGHKIYANRSTRRLYALAEFKYDEPINRTYVDRRNFVEICNPTIKMNSQISGTQDALYHTLVHEMCHYYTYMHGYAPKQAHGPEFRQIGEIVSYRSGGEITVERLANAEVMSNYQWDEDVLKKKEARKEKRKLTANYILIFGKKGGVGLINTHNENLIREIVSLESKDGNEVVQITDPEITEEFYNRGYRKQMRSYRYWPLKQNDETITKLLIKNNAMQKLNENTMNNNSGDVEITPNMNLGVQSPIEEGRGEFGSSVDTVVEMFNNAYNKNKEKIDNHIQAVKESKQYRDLNVRIAWDIARALKYLTWDFLPKDEQGYISVDDSKLTTLFVQALKKSDIYPSVVGDNQMLQEKAKSKSQQRFMGMVDAYKKGELSDDEVSQSVKDAADSMTMKQVKDFAKTKHKGLPNHVKKKKVNESISDFVLRKKIQSILNEQMGDDTYTMEDWKRDGTLKVKEGQLIAPEVYWQLLNGVPPVSTGRIFQPGEAYDMDTTTWEELYQTFKQEGHDLYRYVGLKPAFTLNESKEDKQLRKIIRECLKKKINEISLKTQKSALDKMYQLGQNTRANRFAENTRKNIYYSDIDGLGISQSVYSIQVADAQYARHIYNYDIEEHVWENDRFPRFRDRKAAIVLANLIKKEDPESQYGNKNYYIA